ncbi:MAG: DUF58 domain-containing protein [Nitrososphaerota archaeon]|nr:DUF58 domain-containing protein [Candidatus Brockarchaeota archaeon]
MSIDFEKIRALEKIVKLKIIDLSKKRFASIKGISAELADLREYVEGDDIRFIDWKATARKGRLMLRERIEEKEQNVLIMLDVSGSMGLGAGTSKLKHGVFASAALAYLAVKDKNRVALATFSSFINEFIGFGRSMKHLYAVFNILLNATPYGKTDIEYSVWRMLPRVKSRSLIIIITDMCDEPESIRRAFEILTLKGHKVIVFHIYDPDMYRLPKGVDKVSFIDPSTGKQITLNVKDPLFKATYEALVQAEEKKRINFVRACRAAGIDITMIKTTELVEHALARYLIARKRGVVSK